MREIILNTLPKNSVGCEIGVWKGEFSKQLYDTLQPTKLYLVDPWKYFSEYPDRWYGGKLVSSQEDMDKIFQDVKEIFKDKDEVVILREISENIEPLIKQKSLDWIYIDGNHDFLFVFYDLVTSYFLVKNNGYITGDDYEKGNDIERAVTEFLTIYEDEVMLEKIEGRQFIIKIK